MTFKTKWRRYLAVGSIYFVQYLMLSYLINKRPSLTMHLLVLVGLCGLLYLSIRLQKREEE